MKKHNPVVWFEIYVNNINRAKQFYKEVFQISFTDMEENPDGGDYFMSMFEGDDNGYGISGALIQMKNFPAGNNSTLVYFGTEECLKEQKRVEAAGGKVIRQKYSIGKHGFVSLCEDTEGNMFGLYSMN